MRNISYWNDLRYWSLHWNSIQKSSQMHNFTLDKLHVGKISLQEFEKFWIWQFQINSEANLFYKRLHDS